MVQAAAMLLCLCVLWLVGVQRFSPLDLGVAAGAGVVCLAVSARFGGVSHAFARAPFTIAARAYNAGFALRCALKIVIAASGREIGLRPALVRLKNRGQSNAARVPFANLLSATPGIVSLGMDEDGLLIHVVDERAFDAAALDAMEGRLGGARAS